MGRPRSFDRERTLDIVIDTFWTHGFEGTSMATLEKRTGLGRQSLYGAFGDKESLYQTAVERYAELGRQRVADVFSTASGLEAVAAYFRMLIGFLAGEGEGRGCLVTRSRVDGLACEGVCDRTVTMLSTRLRNALEDARNEGELRKDIAVEDAVGLLLTHMSGLAVRATEDVGKMEMQASTSLLLEGLRA